MEITLHQEVCEKVGPAVLKRYGVDTESFNWQKHTEIDLRRLEIKQLKDLCSHIEPYSKPGPKQLRGASTAVRDIMTWLKVKEAGAIKEVKARNSEKFTSLLIEFMREVPGHRVFQQDTKRGVWMCYYNSSIEFKPTYTDSYGNVHPRHVNMYLFWVEFGGRTKKTVSFYDEDCSNIPVEEALMRQGILPETDEQRERYLAERERFNAECPNIGKQFLATGIATDDVDGNDDSDDDDRWWRDTKTIILDKSGDPANVVIDVFRETDKAKKDKNESMNNYFWNKPVVAKAHAASSEDEEEDIPEDSENTPPPEVPLHPMLVCFDLHRHLRLRIHVSQLEDYVYDPSLGEKLVLPQEQRSLISVLLAHRGGFTDVIKGKGTGAVILCAGVPGTGKTLTAEVYAEVSERPLYTVQCSQLGTDPDELEENLLKSFARSKRWNAIMLLDEADVYVHVRGNSLKQNAIVGVFLRTLEYYKGVMFLTTNRADLVDDAVASRCVALIEYKIPTEDDQRKIWHVLSATAKAPLAEGEIEKILQVHQNLSGRDIKNLLKLAMMVSFSDKKPITADTITFVKKFKPTGSAQEQPPAQGV